jgi:CheY-like chemotaxis protein
MGHEAVFTTDALDAVPLAKKMQPNIMFLDIGLPTIDGYALARIFRQTFGFESIRLVAVTGHTRDEDRALARQAGFDAHVGKPADPVMIEAILKTIFDDPRLH